MMIGLLLFFCAGQSILMTHNYLSEWQSPLCALPVHACLIYITCPSINYNIHSNSPILIFYNTSAKIQLNQFE